MPRDLSASSVRSSGKAEGVVELEGGIAREYVAFLQPTAGFRQQPQAFVQRPAEARLLEFQRLGDERLGAHQLLIGLAHLLHQRRHQPPHQRLLGAEQMRMPHGAAHDATQHVAAPDVGGQHALGDEKAHGAQMVGDDAVGGLVLALGGHAGRRLRGRDQGLEEVDVVDRLHALQDGRHALQPHAGVDGGLGQVDAIAGTPLLVLHEHEVPEFQEAVAVLVGAAGRPARDLVALVEEDLRAGPARPRVAHRPEIIARGDADDLVVGEACDLLPGAIGLLVVVVDGDHETLGLEAEIPGDELPGQRDGQLLEVVAEREVAQHLEEGVVPVGVADVVEVVVLAAGAHALLRRHRARVGPRLLAGEHVLELHHPGRREHQRRIVARHHRRGRHDRVAVPGEEVEECRTDLIDGRHAALLLRAGCRRKLPMEWPAATSSGEVGPLSTNARGCQTLRV